jgi:lysophospholipase L1-like esterase
MKKEYKSNQPVLILLTAIIVLIFSSQIPQFEFIEGVEVKNVDMLGDLKVEEEINEFQFDEYFEDEDSSVDEDWADEDTTEFESKLDAEAIMNKASFNTQLIENFIYEEIEKIAVYNSPSPVSTNNQKITGNVAQLKNFINALKKAKTKKVRIAHFGDSGIEGDLVSADLREILQSKYGGKGLGFLPAITADINYRVSTSFKNSSGWKDFGVNKRNPDRLPVGINGEVFINEAKGWFEYKPNSRFRNSKSFDEIKIYYSDASSTNFTYIIDGKDRNTGKFSTGKGVKEFSAKTPNAKSIKVELPQKEQAYLYGISLESGNGVYVDNFPFRGNTGVDLKDIPLSSLKDFNKYLDYDLIVFQFGLNALSARNFKKYEKDMIKVVDHFKKAFPKASFILIGAQDRSVKRGNTFSSDPKIAKLIQAQINVAKETKIAFWNLFSAMGGKDSMIDWVNANPPLASKDHIHFNESGVKKVAQLFSKALLDVK